jgi:hypothetical protein
VKKHRSPWAESGHRHNESRRRRAATGAALSRTENRLLDEIENYAGRLALVESIPGSEFIWPNTQCRQNGGAIHFQLENILT